MTDNGRATFRMKEQGARLTLCYNIVQDPEDNVTRIMEGFPTFHISDMDIVFEKSMKHSNLVPMVTKLFKTEIKDQIERQVETNMSGFMMKLADVLNNSITKVNRPFLSGIEAARKAVKSARIYDKRTEKVE